MSNHSLSSNLKFFRTFHGYTQDEISRYLHIQRQTYSFYERGMRQPCLEYLIHLADFYQISLDELIRSDIQDSSQNQAYIQMLQHYHHLSPDSQKEIQDYVLFKAAKEKRFR